MNNCVIMCNSVTMYYYVPLCVAANLCSYPFREMANMSIFTCDINIRMWLSLFPSLIVFLLILSYQEYHPELVKFSRGSKM